VDIKKNTPISSPCQAGPDSPDVTYAKDRGETFLPWTIDPNKIPFHPIAGIFPLIEGPELFSLVKDIRVNGLREPIVLHQGKILDGRNRFRACIAAGVTPTFRKYDGEGSPLEYVVSLNLHRRHLDESQRSMIAAKLATLRDGERQVGKFAEVPTQPEAAKMLNVSERTTRSARKVLASGNKELITAVEQGKVAVSRAAKELTPPKLDEEHPPTFAEHTALKGSRFNLKKQCKFLRGFLAIAISDWPDDHQEELASELEAIASEIRKAGMADYD
jgi:hypothetical protein